MTADELLALEKKYQESKAGAPAEAKGGIDFLALEQKYQALQMSEEEQAAAIPHTEFSTMQHPAFQRAMPAVLQELARGATFGLTPSTQQFRPQQVPLLGEVEPLELIGEQLPLMGVSGAVKGVLRGAPRLIRAAEPFFTGAVFGGAKELIDIAKYGEEDPAGEMLAKGFQSGAAFMATTLFLKGVAGTAKISGKALQSMTNYILDRVSSRTGDKLPKSVIEQAVQQSVSSVDDSVIDALRYNVGDLAPGQRAMIEKRLPEITRAELEWRGINPDEITAAFPKENPAEVWGRYLKMTKGSAGAYQEHLAKQAQGTTPGMPELEGRVEARGARVKPAPKAKAPQGERASLEEYAKGVVGENVKSVYLVGSTAKGKLGKDVDIVYDFGKRTLPKDQAAAEGAVEALIESTPGIDTGTYDTFIKVGNRYFNIATGAGRAVVENTEYGKAQAGKPMVELAKVLPKRAPRGGPAPEPKVATPTPQRPQSMLEVDASDLMDVMAEEIAGPGRRAGFKPAKEITLGPTIPGGFSSEEAGRLLQTFPELGKETPGVRIYTPAPRSKARKSEAARIAGASTEKLDLQTRSMPWKTVQGASEAKALKVAPEGRGWKITDGEEYFALTLDDVLLYIMQYPEIPMTGPGLGPGAMGPVKDVGPKVARLVWKQPKQLDLGFEVPEEAKYLDIVMEGRPFKDVGVLSYVADPQWNFKAMGLEDVGNMILGAMKTRRDWAASKMQQMRVWNKLIGPGKDAPGRVWRTTFLGKPLAQDLENMAPAEFRVFEEMKKSYSESLGYINTRRAKKGMPPVPPDAPYAPGIIEDAVWTLMRHAEVMGSPKAAAVPPEVYRALQYMIPEEKFLGHVLERHGRLPFKQDAFSAFQAYVRAVSQAQIADDVLPIIKQLTGPKSTIPEGSKNYLRWFAESEILGRPSQFDLYTQSTLGRLHKGLIGAMSKLPGGGEKGWGYKDVHLKLLKDGALQDVAWQVPRFGIMLEPRPLTRLVSGYKTLSYMSLIGMNMKTMATNLSQPIITPALLKGGPGQRWNDFAYGYGKAISEYAAPFFRALKKGTTIAEERSEAVIKYENLGVLSQMEELYTGPGLGWLRQKFSDFTFWNMRTSEFMNRVSTYHAKTRNLAMVEKVFGEEAKQISGQFSDMINFRYGPGWRSRATAANPFANLAFQYQSFTLKQLFLLGNMAKGMYDPSSIPKFYTAAMKGKGVEFLEAMPMFERTAVLRYTLHAGAVATGLSLMGIPSMQIWLRSLVPGVGPGIELALGTFKAINGTDRGEFERGLSNMIPLRRAMEQVGLMEQQQVGPRAPSMARPPGAPRGY